MSVGTDLKYVESLELNVLALISQEVHHHLQVRLIRDVSCHDVEVSPVQQDLAEELQRLSLRDVVLGSDEGRVGGEELRGGVSRRDEQGKRKRTRS